MELREETFISELKVDLDIFVCSYIWDMLHKNTFTFVLSFTCRILTDCDSSIDNVADEDMFGCPNSRQPLPEVPRYLQVSIHDMPKTVSGRKQKCY